MRRRTTIGLILGLILIGFVTPGPGAAAQEVGNLLENGSFEWDWRHQGAAELFFPDPWRLEYRDGDHPWCASPCKRPEITINEEYVADGAYSVRAFAPAHSRALFALYQEFEAEAYSQVTLVCQVRTTSRPEGGLLVAAAIQPWAGSFFESSAIRGEATRVRDEWTTVTVTAPVYGGGRGKAAVVYEVEWPSQNNTVWIDDCELTRAGAGCPPCECPELPSCPPCGSGELDWDRMRDVIRSELANREPVRWPR